MWLLSHGGWALKNENIAQNTGGPFVGGRGFMHWNVYRVIITESCSFHDSWKRHRRTYAFTFTSCSAPMAPKQKKWKRESCLLFLGSSSGYWTWSLEAGRRGLKSLFPIHLTGVLRTSHWNSLGTSVSSPAKWALWVWMCRVDGKMNEIIWEEGSQHRSQYSWVPTKWQDFMVQCADPARGTVNPSSAISDCGTLDKLLNLSEPPVTSGRQLG